VDNTVNNRAHSLDFTGQRWLKLVVTAVAEGGSAVQLDELTVHDVSSSPTGVIDDTWVFFGDSITQLAFRRDLATAASFDAQSQERQAERFPAFVNAGVGGDTLPLALARLDQVLELNADMKYFALGFGTNDAWNNSDPSTVAFEDNLRQLIVGIQAAGRVPVLARIPFAGDANATPASTHIGLPAYNDVVDALQAEFGLPCGPDLYELFAQAPSGLGGDGVHPNLVGYASMNAAWADRAQSLYVGAQ
jgi:lysophospholipase L1-like esterase